MIKSYLIGAIMMVAPFFMIAEPMFEVRIAQEYFFIASAFLCLAFLQCNYKLPLIISFLAFINLPVYSNILVFYQWIIFSCGMIFLSACNGLDKEIIKKALIIVAVLQSVYMILEQFDFSFHFFLHKLFSEVAITRVHQLGSELVKPYGSVGSLGQHTLSAVMPAALIPLFINKKYYYLIPVLIFGVATSGSAMSWLTMVIAVFVYTTLNFKKRTYMFSFAIPIGMLSLAVYYFRPDFFYSGMRFQAWKVILDNVGLTFFGKGLGYFYTTEIFKNAAGHIFRQSHNSILDLYVTFGVSGFIILFLVLKRIKVNDYAIFAIFIALIVNSICNITFNIAPLSLITILCYSILSEDNDGRKKTTTI